MSGRNNSPLEYSDPFAISLSALPSRAELRTVLPAVSSPLLGQRFCALDDKNRIYLPGEWRPHYEEGLVLIPSRDHTLLMINPGQLEIFFKNLVPKDANANLKDARLCQISAAATALPTLDSANRFTLPAAFTRRWSLATAGRLTVCGVVSFIEIHTEESWRRLQAEGTLWSHDLRMPPPGSPSQI